MQNILSVHELDALTDLSHEHGAGSLGQHEVFINHSLEQLSACYAANEKGIMVTTFWNHCFM